ncbi:Metallo-dependent phosphatase [Durotheca rogersii]|uniref:Metallo-dependent phosphatase n=1 Tax=Durotheca rogersii TaxID=419775 RepID=UPI00221F5846|nr:Metallo-dependent phosphatase [Durotheca rogersii]KAI5865212.1 Metallo-dependent phosphatase [Durotheca rogersii]
MVHLTLPVLSFAAASLAGLVSAGDSLYSRRMSKRFIDTDGNFNISFYHINDVHAHLDEFSSSGTDCTNPTRGCYGGYARVKTVVDETRPGHPDSLWLNVGDEFQGTLFYSFYRGEKIAETLNQLGFDAMTLGNHEFDGGDEELGDFLKNLTFPVISANIISDNEKLNSTIKPYHIFEKYELAVIGVTTETTSSISNPGKGTTFTDSIAAVQASIDEIRRTTNITRIAAITHIGYEEDKRLARETTGLQLIMGGHSHTLLGDMEDAEGKYPTIETNKDGDEVFIVTAYRWGEYLGYIDVTYNPQGKILAYHGAPIHLTNTTEQDQGLQAQIDEWRGPFEEFAKEEIGTTNVLLDQSTCRQKECTLGDLVSDALYQFRVDGGSEAAFSIVNAGGIRASIDVGPITRGEVLTAFPFGNAVVEVQYSGTDLWRIFEGLVSGVSQFNGRNVTSFFQVSRGIKVEYNPNNAVGQRLVRLTIGGAPVDLTREYVVVTVDFLTGGGDNIFEPVNDVVALETMDEVLVSYIRNNSPIDFELEGRIAIVEGSSNGSNSDTPASNTTFTTSPASPSTTGPLAPTITPSSADKVGGVVSSAMLLVFTAMLAVVVSS